MNHPLVEAAIGLGQVLLVVLAAVLVWIGFWYLVMRVWEAPSSMRASRARQASIREIAAQEYSEASRAMQAIDDLYRRASEEVRRLGT